ncbi:MAG: hypothetical protein AAGA54_31375 [Myxococcota bacterium]
MSNNELEALVSDIPSLRACLIIEAQSGALHRSFRRGSVPADPDAAARALAQLARAQADVFGTGEPASLATLEWTTETVLLRSVNASALMAFYFPADVKLGLARMHVTRVLDRAGSLLPVAGQATVLEIPAVPAPAPVVTSAPPPSPPSKAASAPAEVSAGRKLIDYLDANAPDTHAALLRVSLQTGLPLSLLKTPDELSSAEFEQVTQSVQRILGVEQLSL